MKMRPENAEVFYPAEELVIVAGHEIDALKRAALASPKKRARICTHAEPTSDLHEMLIVLSRDTYVRPHKHLGKTESFSIIEGEAEVILFHDDGTIRQRIQMGTAGSQYSFYYRLSEPVFHMIVVRSEFLVVHEVTGGPFIREQTVFAEWSPEEGNTAGISAFLCQTPPP